MESLFLTIFNMSITASYIVLVVILLRAILKKAPKALRGIMWAVVGVRLICPFSIESILSLIPSTDTVPENIIYTPTPYIDSGISYLNQTVNPIISGSFSPTPSDSANPLQIWVFIAAIVWIVGMCGMCLYTIISYLKIQLKVREAAIFKDNIYLCDSIGTPFILGIIKPKIYLPSSLDNTDCDYVIAHEKAHIKRLDYLWKPLGFLLLTIYWFNPILWVAYVLLCKDIELACDEKVIKQMGAEIKKPYSEALINCSVPKRLITACPLAFGETGVKGRIKSVLNYKKPTFWVISVALICCIVLSVCFLTNPKSNTIMHIEDVDLSSYLENTLSVQKWDGETFENVMSVDKELIKQILNLKISKNPVSQNRSEDGSRDLSNTVVLQSVEDLYPSIYSKLEGLYISFNKDFTEVYIPYGLAKLTLSYHVKDPDKARALYESMITVNQYSHLQTTYPEFFELDVTEGLIVYVCEWSPNNYKCALESALYDDISDKSLTVINGCSMAEMRAILSSYNVKREKIKIRVVNNSLSSYRINITEKYRREIEKKFWSTPSYTGVNADNIFKTVYKEYLGLSTAKGLEVYVWKTGTITYQCVLKSGRNLVYTDDEIFASSPVDLGIMRTILSTYDIPQNQISFYPVVHPEHRIAIDEKDIENVKYILFGLSAYDNFNFDEWGLKMSVNFIDDNVLQVAFEHSQEHQKEVGRLTVTPEYEIRAIHKEAPVSFGFYMREVLGQKHYKDKIFSWDSVIYTIPSGESYTLTSDLDVTYGKLPLGEYLIYKKVRFEDKDGNYSIRTYCAPFAIVE
ncbi:MAG: hypothetical protein E7545_06930 [Ruminococcaceae bacterium]|nr:hypothetical protein [Oscillospiraceae bacterium]